MNKLFRIALISIISGGIRFLGTMCFLGFDFSKLDTTVYVNNTYEFKEDIKNITINTTTSHIAVYPSADNTLKVTCHEKEHNPYTVTAKGDSLTITKKDSFNLKNLILFPQDHEDISLYLPEKIYESIKINCTTGDTIIEKINTENLSVETTTGDVTVSQTNCKDICLNVTTGDITLSAINAENSLKTKTTTGDVNLDLVLCSKGSIECKTTTGNITFSNCDAAKSITANATTGDISGTFLSSKNFTTKVTTGKVNVPESITGCAECYLKTTTGNINISIASF